MRLQPHHVEVRAPLVQERKGEFRELFESARKQGFVRAVVDDELIELADPPKLNRRTNHSISVVVDRLVVRADDRGRITDSLETALRLADGLAEVVRYDGEEPATENVFRTIWLSNVRHFHAGT